MAKSEQASTGTIGKVDLIRMACKKAERRISFDEMSDAYTAILDSLVECFHNGNTVVLQNVGRFIPIIRPGGEGRNPSTGETITYGDRLGLKFNINANLKVTLRQVDIKSLGTGAAGVDSNEKGSSNKTGRGGSTEGRGKAVAGESRRSNSGQSAASSRPARRR